MRDIMSLTQTRPGICTAGGGGAGVPSKQTIPLRVASLMPCICQSYSSVPGLSFALFFSWDKSIISVSGETDERGNPKENTSFGGAPTVDRRNPAPPRKPWNDDSPVNINKP